MQDANVRMPPTGAGFFKIEHFQNYYLHTGIAIVVYDKKTFGSGEPPFFDGRAVVERQRGCETQRIINLCYNSNAKHYDTILKLIGVSRTKFFCTFCNKCFNFIDQHKCLKTCSKCFVSPACKTDNVDLIKCSQCNRNFFGNMCYDNHLKDGSYKKKKKNCAM